MSKAVMAVQGNMNEVVAAVQENNHQDETEQSNHDDDNNDDNNDDNTELSFFAKDGKYYATYMEKVAANKAYNEMKLEEAGLGVSSFRLQRQRQNNTSMKRRMNRTDRSHNKNVLDRRRQSNRLQQKRAQISSSLSSPLSLTVQPLDDPEQLLMSRTVQQQQSRRRRESMVRQRIGIAASQVVSHSSTSSSTSSTPSFVLDQLTPTQRQQLKERYERTDTITEEPLPPLWIEDMEDYLTNVAPVSKANARSVLRQVVKLVTGIGITYSRWSDGISFHQNRILSLYDTNLEILYDEACEFEETHGRDLGNGTFSCINCNNMSMI
jgi:hypothetical protein